MAKKAFEPTDQQRHMVKMLTVAGVGQEDVGKALGISADTVQKYFGKELDEGINETNGKVVAALYKSALSGNVSAQIFWCKTRLRWRETDTLELTAANGANLIPVININVKKE